MEQLTAYWVLYDYVKQFWYKLPMKTVHNSTDNFIRIRSGNRSLMSFLKTSKTEEGIVTVGKVLERFKYLIDRGKSPISR